jgi:GTPase SAR1 family protein
MEHNFDDKKLSANEGKGYRISDPQSGGFSSNIRENNLSRKFKLVLIGDSQVGKSALILRYIQGIYEDALQIQSVGIEYYSKFWEHDGYLMNFNIWDCACHKDFRRMMIRYYWHPQNLDSSRTVAQSCSCLT